MTRPSLATSIEVICQLAEYIKTPDGAQKLAALAQAEEEAKAVIIQAEAKKAELAGTLNELALLKERIEQLPAEETRLKSEHAARSVELDRRVIALDGRELHLTETYKALGEQQQRHIQNVELHNAEVETYRAQVAKDRAGLEELREQVNELIRGQVK